LFSARRRATDSSAFVTMRLAELFSIASAPDIGPRPMDDELDLFGMTHVGRVRTENQDHFLLATVHPQVVMHATSLPVPNELPLRGQRLATLLLVADGVGGTDAGAEASRVAAETIARYVASSLRCYHTVGQNDREFLDALRAAAHEAHQAVREDAATRLRGQTTATTLTLGIVVWPWLYVLQVGDSRFYYFSSGRLRQVSRDQTLAQDLIDQGLLSPDRASSSGLGNVLSSAIGAEQARPEVTRVDIHERGGVLLACSDGLTKHVSDAEIAEQLRTMSSAEQACHSLVDLALARGGSDNITIVIGRALRRS
jgi:serine/threonine protein phosphatase PrpC